MRINPDNFGALNEGDMHQLHPTVLAIKSELKKRGISYDKLGDLTQIEVSKIKKIMSGVQGMTLDDRDIICHAIGMSVFDITMMANPLSTSSSIEIFRLLMSLPERTRAGFVTAMLAVKSDIGRDLKQDAKK